VKSNSAGTVRDFAVGTKYCIIQEQGIYNVTNFMELRDIDFSGCGSFYDW
jgi:hypothetical protein